MGDPSGPWRRIGEGGKGGRGGSPLNRLVCGPWGKMTKGLNGGIVVGAAAEDTTTVSPSQERG